MLRKRLAVWHSQTAQPCPVYGHYKEGLMKTSTNFMKIIAIGAVIIAGFASHRGRKSKTTRRNQNVGN